MYRVHLKELALSDRSKALICVVPHVPPCFDTTIFKMVDRFKQLGLDYFIMSSSSLETINLAQSGPHVWFSDSETEDEGHSSFRPLYQHDFSVIVNGVTLHCATFRDLFDTENIYSIGFHDKSANLPPPTFIPDLEKPMIRTPKRVRFPKPQHFTVDSMPMDEFNATIGWDDKEFRTSSWSEDSARFNERETRRREYKKRVARRSLPVPHAEEVKEESLRNRLARVVFDTPKLDSSTFADTLSSVAETREYFKGFKDQKEMDKAISCLENIVVLAYQVSKSSSLLDVFVAVVAYVKAEYPDGSITMSLYGLIDELLSSDDSSPHAWKEWTGRDCLDMWEMFKTNTIFKHVSFLISAAMSISACKSKCLEWSPYGFKVVSIYAAQEQLHAVDVIDACIKTFVWMYETGARCIASGSLLPLLYSDQRTQDYNSRFSDILARAEHAVAGNVDDLGSFEKDVDDLIRITAELKNAKSDGPTAMWIQSRYVTLVQIKEKLICKRRNTDIRPQPIGFSLCGGTGVGKTTLGKMTMNHALAAMGFHDEKGVVDDSRIMTLDTYDKYQSTYTSDILGMFIDDVANTKPTYVQESPPTALIIKFFNNVAAQAIKAELNAKGMVFIDFRVGVVTTNKRDLDATVYSNCPESILRRFYHVDVKVKDKYRAKDSPMLNKSHPEVLAAKDLEFDVWDLTISECYASSEKGKEQCKFRDLVIDFDGNPEFVCANLDLETYLRVISHLSAKHKAEQDLLIEKTRKNAQKQFCLECKQLPKFCRCTTKPHALVEDVLIPAVQQGVAAYLRQWYWPVDWFKGVLGYSPVRRMTTSYLASCLKKGLDRHLVPVSISLLPTYLYQSKQVQCTISRWERFNATYDINNTSKVGIVVFALLCLFFLYRAKFAIASVCAICSFAVYLVMRRAYRARLMLIRNDYLLRRDALPEYVKNFRDSKLVAGALLTVTVGIGIKLISVWNKRRLDAMQTHSLDPTEIDQQPGWFSHLVGTLGWSAKTDVKGAVPSHIALTVEKHLGRATFVTPTGKMLRTNVLIPKKGIVWFPKHVFYPECDMSQKAFDYLRVTVERSPDKFTSSFKFIAEPGVNCVASENVDMIAAFVERCPDIRDNFVKFLPLDKPRGRSMGTIVSRNKDCELVCHKTTATYGVRGHRYMEFYGADYTSPLAVNGACMSTFIAEGKHPCITGVHIGGNGADYGILQTVTQDEAHVLEQKLYELKQVRGFAQATDLPETQYGREILPTTEVHAHAKFIHDLPDTAAIDVYGSTRLRSQMTSRVVTSPISDSITKHFHVKNQWGAPQLKPNWKAFNATLEHIISPADPFMPSLLERARQDWVSPIISFAQQLPEKIRPLDDKEMVMGVPGKRFLDAIPMDTSMGFPVFGSKNKFFEEVRDGEVLIDRVPNFEVRQEMKRLMDCWERGERAYPVTTATLKDEPTPLNKEKVRVFQAVAVALGLYIRKYYLPIARILSLNPLLSESAVGVNAFSLQWEELMAHAEKYAEDDRVLAWDYSKYDIRMGAQITYAVLMSFIDIAEVCSYSQHDLKIMNAMVADIIHPLVDYNGTMIMAFNLNTSGNNITVNINGAAGSLLVRMGLFHAIPECEDARSILASMTYGDDYKGSIVKKYRDRFNFMTYKNFLAEHGMKITPPNKSDDEFDDMHNDDVDFLKRQSNFIPEIGHSIGKLAESSIFKSLHANLQSKSITQREVAASCIETAMHEWFAHGRKIYEDRQQRMLRVCEDEELPIPAVGVSFDDRVRLWKEKYVEGLDTKDA